jgi:hypothetical protein
MAIKKLKNPLTEEYFALKQNIFSSEFPWYIHPNTAGEYKKDIFMHGVVKRPKREFNVPLITSRHFDLINRVLIQIFEHNNLDVNVVLRIVINLSINYGGGPACDPHYDHRFPHKNLLIYLNDSSGATVVIDSETNKEEYFHPQEDAIVTFEGEHYHYQPNVGEKRVVLVATYI